MEERSSVVSNQWLSSTSIFTRSTFSTSYWDGRRKNNIRSCGLQILLVRLPRSIWSTTGWNILLDYSTWTLSLIQHWLFLYWMYKTELCAFGPEILEGRERCKRGNKYKPHAKSIMARIQLKEESCFFNARQAVSTYQNPSSPYGDFLWITPQEVNSVCSLGGDSLQWGQAMKPLLQ